MKKERKESRNERGSKNDRQQGKCIIKLCKSKL